MTVTVATKKAVIKRDGGWCLLALPGCRGEAQTTHHRANRGMGGSSLLDDPINLVAVCTICNAAAEDANGIVRLDLIERGLRVERAATNLQTLARARQTPVTDLEGDQYYLIDEHERIHVNDIMKEAR